jgi:hypothetical protein
MELARMEAGLQMELQQQKAQTDIQTSQVKADHDMSIKQKDADTKAQQTANEGTNLASAIGEAVAGAIGKFLDKPLKVEMPRMKRTAVRDKQGNITHAIDEPLETMQ